MVVVVEIVSERRDPRKLPSHSLLERFDLRPCCPRYRDQSRISLRQVRSDGVKLVRDKRATGTSLFPSRTKHEVIYHQLAEPAEQIRKLYSPVWSFEHVFLFYLFPGQFPPLAAQFIAQMRQFLFFCQELLA